MRHKKLHDMNIAEFSRLSPHQLSSLWRRTRSFPTLPLSMCAYLAGLFDGEGSISTGIDKRKQVSCIVVSIGVTSEAEIKALHREVGLPGSMRVDKTGGKSKRRKPLFQWSMTQRAAAWFLRSVLPWLRIKKERAEVALELYDLMQRTHRAPTPEVWGEREALAGRLRMLNHRDGSGWNPHRLRRHPTTPRVEV